MPGPRCIDPVDFSRSDYELFVERLSAGAWGCPVSFDVSRLMQGFTTVCLTAVCEDYIG